jgi:hypothetical protein
MHDYEAVPGDYDRDERRSMCVDLLREHSATLDMAGTAAARAGVKGGR